MRAVISRYVIGIAVAAVGGGVSALPFSIGGPSPCVSPIAAACGLPGTAVTVSLDDAGAISPLDSATILLQYNPAVLDYTASSLGTLFPGGSSLIENADETLGRVIFSLSSNTLALTGVSGSLLAVDFDILAGAPGLTEVSFRCVPFNTGVEVNAITDQASADQLCAPDYAIPATAGNVARLAATEVPGAQVPIANTAWLALLGLGLLGWIRRN